MRKGLFVSILLLKVITFLTIAFAYTTFPFFQRAYYGSMHYPPHEKISLITAYKTWDAQHYLYLSHVGYQPHQLSNAFYPLFPFLIHLVSLITHNPFWSGMLISNTASVVALYVLYLFIKERTNDEFLAKKSLLLLLVFPTSFYLSLIYTESLFLLLSVCFFYYLYRGNNLLAALFAFFLPLTRPVGILILIPWCIHAYLGKKGGEFGDKKLLYLLSPLFGYFIYFLLLYLMTGDPFSGMKAEQRWLAGRGFFNLFNPSLFFHQLFSPRLKLFDSTTSGLMDRVFFLFYLVCLPLVYKKTDKVLFSFYVVMGSLPLLGSFISYTRFLMAVFPLYMGLAAFFGQKEYKWLFLPFLLISYLMSVLFTMFYALNYWVA